jgi:hypothetical protein
MNLLGQNLSRKIFGFPDQIINDRSFNGSFGVSPRESSWSKFGAEKYLASRSNDKWLVFRWQFVPLVRGNRLGRGLLPKNIWLLGQMINGWSFNGSLWSCSEGIALVEITAEKISGFLVK